MSVPRMGSVNLVVVVESVRTIVTHNSADDTNALHVPSLIAVAAALGAPLPPSLSSPSLLTADDERRREVRAVFVLHPPPAGVEPGGGPLGGPPQ